jgi:hypothetical protein
VHDLWGYSASDIQVTPLDLDAIEALCAAATEGPWKCWNGWGPKPDGDMAMTRIGACDRGGVHSGGGGRDIYATVEDAEFTAVARTALPQAVAEIRALREALTDLVDNYHRPMTEWDDETGREILVCRDGCDGDWPCAHGRARAVLAGTETSDE